MNCRISKAFQISNEPTINLTILITFGDREGNKKENPTSEKCYIPNMDLSIVEFNVNSPCF
jgi:hypothetical protein